MNLKQQNFAEYYVQSGNATTSALQAGYSQKTAYSQGQRLLKNVEVAEYIRQLSETAQNERIMTTVDRQALLSDIAKNDENSPTERIRAIDTLNKMTGEYTTKISAEVEASPKLADIFAQLTTDELKVLANLDE